MTSLPFAIVLRPCASGGAPAFPVCHGGGSAHPRVIDQSWQREMLQWIRTLYSTILRGEETMLVNTPTAAQNPILHLRRVPSGRVFDHYVNSFDRVWAAATPVSDVNTVIDAFEKRES